MRFKSLHCLKNNKSECRHPSLFASQSKICCCSLPVLQIAEKGDLTKSGRFCPDSLERTRTDIKVDLHKADGNQALNHVGLFPPQLIQLPPVGSTVKSAQMSTRLRKITAHPDGLRTAAAKVKDQRTVRAGLRS